MNGFDKGYFLFHLLRCESGDTANPSGVSKERNVIFGHGLNPLRRISPDRIGWMEALEWTGSERFCEDVLLGWVISVIHGLKITFSLQSQIGPIINEVRHLVTTETKRKITITSVGVMLVPSPTIHSFFVIMHQQQVTSN